MRARMIVMWQVRFRIQVARPHAGDASASRPRPRPRNRSQRYSSVGSRPSLCSAFAAAECRTCAITVAAATVGVGDDPAARVYSRHGIRSRTYGPSCSTSPRAAALRVSRELVASSPRHAQLRRRPLLAGVVTEGTRRRELADLRPTIDSVMYTGTCL